MSWIDIFRRRQQTNIARVPPIDIPIEAVLKHAKLSPVAIKLLEQSINELRDRRKDQRPPSFSTIDKLQNVLRDAMSLPTPKNQIIKNDVKTSEVDL